MRSVDGKAVATLLLLLSLGLVSSPAVADKKCKYPLSRSGEEIGTAGVEYDAKKRELKIKVKSAFRNTMYTVWIDFRNRATGQLADDYPLKLGALERGVAPSFATTAGVTNGIILDPNAFVTDKKGKKDFKVKLDYDILARASSPVVAGELALQGQSRVGGNWLRQFRQDPSKQASLQAVDPSTGGPLLPRSTPQGITVVRHPDFVSHGHTPGVSRVDHFPAFNGDFPYECLWRR